MAADYKIEEESVERPSFLSVLIRTINIVFLIILAIVMLFFLVLIKSKTTVPFSKNQMLFFYAIFVTTFVLSRVIASMFYNRTLRKLTKGSYEGGKFEPRVSFIIPCKNEEKAIAKTISRCFDVDYPKDKMEVIVINDGSTDNTLFVLKNIKKKFGNLTVIGWERNRGKRHAMAAGIRRASGDIIIQMDSDSFIKPNTFRKLIEPFQNLEIGAVCAHATPENANENILTRMQAAYYFMSFRILKAAESAFATVFCCSGCSSAYRKSVVLPILDKWLNERFLGKPVTWGDDRALTSWVLKSGYKTVYTDKARAYTIVPNNLSQLLKQQIRWKKSWIINSFFTSKFIYKKQPFVAFFYYFPLLLVSFLTPFMALRALIYDPIFSQVAPIYYFLGVLFVTTLIVIYYRLLAPRDRYWPYLFLWSMFNILFLSYLIFYAALNLQNRKWGTR